MEIKKSVGIWIRVSTDFQVKDESPETHQKRAQLYAEAKGWNVVEIYRLDAISGKSVMEQPETKRMLKDMKSGHITGLIFSKLARLARNTKELLEFSELFRENNADLISLSESIDTSSPAGRLFYTMIAALSEWERSEIAERVSASVPIRAKMGKPLGGQASFGYRWDGKELVIDENEAPVRKLIYELFLKHKRKFTVANTLNESGYRTRSGSKFTDTTIGRLLRDSTAKGERRANYTKSLGDNKNWVYKPESEWVVTECPPIVQSELWNECNLMLDAQEKTRKKPAKKPVHLFTGIVYCECGSKMYIPSDSKKYICYQCRKNRIEMGDLEEIYYENLKSFLLTDQHLGEFLSKADFAIKEKEELLYNLTNQAKSLETEMDRLVKLHTKNEMPTDGFGKHYKPLAEQLKQIEQQIPEIQGEIDFLKIEHLNGDQLLSDAKSLYDRWPKLELEGKRQIVEQVTNTITVAQEEIKIKFTYAPTILLNTPDSQRNFIPALAFCDFEISANREQSKHYPKELITIGNHIRKRRIDLKFKQEDVARIIEVTEECITNWENDKATPMIRYMPKITEFLGYSLFEGETETLGGKIKCYRYANGLSYKNFGKMLGVDATTVSAWEDNRSLPNRRKIKVLIEKLITNEVEYKFTE